jgi:membrane protease subunit HflK
VTEYQKAPGVTRDRLYLDSAIGARQFSKILIDQKSGSNLLNLPLNQLLQQGAVAATVPPVDVGAVPARHRAGAKRRERCVALARCAAQSRGEMMAPTLTSFAAPEGGAGLSWDGPAGGRP